LHILYHIERKGLDHGCEGCSVDPLINSRVTEKEIKMTKQNKNRKKQAVEEIIESQSGLCEYPFDKDFHYDNWWNQFRGPWLKSETMTDEQIRIKADDAWECGDYKEMINLMAELICRLQK
jgi:hypothetical protein